MIRKQVNIFKFSKIGFIGMGNMGYPMALNLKKQNQDMIVYDSNPQRKEELKKDFRVADSIKELAQNSNFVLTMLPNEKILQDVCLDENGLFKNLSKHSVVCDSSTISSIKAVELSKKAFEFGLTFLDAPVSGGISGAKAGTLTFMLGCAQNPVSEKCSEILSQMGKKVFICGAPGSGQIAKMCNNAALAIQMASISEALVLGSKMGIDLKLLTEIMSVSTSSCWSLNVQNPQPGILPNAPSSNDYNGGFMTQLMHKDLEIASKTSKESGLNLEFLERIREKFSQIVEAGDGQKDFSILMKYMKEGKLK